ncbi:MAG: sugar phosphate nucleotidyltransferase [Parcubacteria group bacterium]
MRGVILCGGLGTRLLPLTKLVNKHMLPVYDRLMGEYPLEVLVKAGIKDIMIVTGEKSAGSYVNYFKNGEDFGCRLVYGFQPGGDRGISDAISVAEEFCEGDKAVVINGDNYFEDDITPYIKSFEKVEKGAMILLTEVLDPERSGVARIENGKIVEIVEKPKNPPTNFIQTGLYMYDQRVFDFIRTLKPSGRNELEVSDLNNIYIKEGTMRHEILKGGWFDMGTFDSLLDASNFVRDKKKGEEK